MRQSFLGYTTAAILISNPVILVGVLGITSLAGLGVTTVTSILYAKEVATLKKIKVRLNAILAEAI
jgi:hypothetical protein